MVIAQRFEVFEQLICTTLQAIGRSLTTEAGQDALQNRLRHEELIEKLSLGFLKVLNGLCIFIHLFLSPLRVLKRPQSGL